MKLCHSTHFKQYCLEDGVNLLKDGDFVIHLDEETVLTEDAVRGILNFVFDNKHAIGQGNDLVIENYRIALLKGY